MARTRVGQKESTGEKETIFYHLQQIAPGVIAQCGDPPSAKLRRGSAHRARHALRRYARPMGGMAVWPCLVLSGVVQTEYVVHGGQSGQNVKQALPVSARENAITFRRLTQHPTT